MSKEDTIIDVSYELFSKYWYKNVSLDRITADSWVAKWTFYLYFKNKDAWYKRIVDDMISYHAYKLWRRKTQIIWYKERVYCNIYYSILWLEESRLIRNIIQKNKDYFSESVNIDYLEKSTCKDWFDELFWVPEKYNKEKIKESLRMIMYFNTYLVWVKNSFENQDEYYAFIKNYVNIIVSWLFSDFDKNNFDLTFNDNFNDIFNKKNKISDLKNIINNK